MLAREWTVGLEIDSVLNREDGEDCLAKRNQGEKGKKTREKVKLTKK